MFRRATLTAVRASISTPVFSCAETVTVTLIESSSAVSTTSTFSILSGWHKANISGVFLTANIAIVFDMAIGSPFSSLPRLMSSSVFRFSNILPVAVACLNTTGFLEMSACLTLIRCFRRPLLQDLGLRCRASIGIS